MVSICLHSQHKARIKLSTIINNIVLWGEQYCTLYGPNLFLVNYPRWVLFPLGNHRKKSLNLNCSSKWCCWLHRAAFHYWVLVVSIARNLSFGSFSGSNILLVNTHGICILVISTNDKQKHILLAWVDVIHRLVDKKYTLLLPYMLFYTRKVLWEDVHLNMSCH
jgi:hypothetical protein